MVPRGLGLGLILSTSSCLLGRFGFEAERAEIPGDNGSPQGDLATGDTAMGDPTIGDFGPAPMFGPERNRFDIVVDGMTLSPMGSVSGVRLGTSFFSRRFSDIVISGLGYVPLAPPRQQGLGTLFVLDMGGTGDARVYCDPTARLEFAANKRVWMDDMRQTLACPNGNTIPGRISGVANAGAVITSTVVGISGGTARGHGGNDTRVAVRLDIESIYLTTRIGGVDGFGYISSGTNLYCAEAFTITPGDPRTFEITAVSPLGDCASAQQVAGMIRGCML